MRILGRFIPSEKIYLSLCIVVFCGALLSSCASPPDRRGADHREPDQRALKEKTTEKRAPGKSAGAGAQNLIGMDQDGVRQCLGAPQSTRKVATRDVWTYRAPLPSSASGDPSKPETCLLVLQFDNNDAVRNVSYYIASTGIAGDRDAACAFMARGCKGD